MSREATERRLRAAGFARLETDEEIVTWCRAWVSKAGRFQRFAPRWRDVVVVTDRRLLLFGVGHFTRRPRRRVLADRLDELTLGDVGTHPGRGLRCMRPGRPDMLLELDGDPWSRRLVQELQDRVAHAHAHPAEPPAPAEPAPEEPAPEEPAPEEPASEAPASEEPTAEEPTA
jgi:hypothetical protein